MKKILFVVNTMGRAGAELSLLSLLKKLDGKEYEVSLYVLMCQGEMIKEVPSYVRIKNTVCSSEPVLSKEGRNRLVKTVLKAFFKNGGYVRKLRYIAKSLRCMMKIGRIQPDKLLWRMAADGAERFPERFDLAVAWLEGGSAYYVADWVNAKKKAAFIHIDYEKAGYTREMDGSCWRHFDKIFAVSNDARNQFLNVYPELENKTAVFPNIVDQEYIRLRAKEKGGFTDHYDGMRILTVGRLTYQKGYDIAVDAMKILKNSGCHVRWYVLGEGDQREKLEKKITLLGLEDDFILLGAAENPYPYYAQADLYVHAVRYEGQGIAVWEAQTLGRAVIVSDYCGSRGQIEDGKYGISCELTPQGIAESVRSLLDDREKREGLERMAAEKKVPKGQERLFFELLE